ncbi:MAG: phosphoribosyl-AMP cyclohydrolase [Armatimonadetes bacterium]|jgi:phosphoribosyl-AMP cyclohydrolase|nr:phosphoribosyl-AMP cyclohydrolase [Armatimonadota bacterium]HOC31053.1 phosphoribosyl-AMP cyclohydrolase [Armatimonadota bacterium]
MIDTTTFKYDANGLIPAVIQDDENGDVLMVGYMNAEAVRRTLESKRITFWSRSRQEYWVKGATSGFTQELQSAYYDCDRDALLFRVIQKGAACHEGYRTCFYTRIDGDGEPVITREQLVKPY